MKRTRTVIKTGPGRGVGVDEGAVHTAQLFDFDINGGAIKEAHKRHLRARVVPMLRTDASKLAWIDGKASETGDEQNNVDLSNERSESVLAFLHQEAGVALDRMFRFALGSSAATHGGEDASERAVSVRVTPKGSFPDPPRPPPTPAPARPPAPPPRGPTGDAPQVALGVSPSTGTTLFQFFRRTGEHLQEDDLWFWISNSRPTKAMRIEIRAEGVSYPLRTFQVPAGHALLGTDQTLWTWDGFDDDGVLDSVILRNRLLFIYVYTDNGTGFAAFKAKPDTDPPKFADARVYRRSRTIDVLAYVDISGSLVPGKTPTDAEVAKAKQLIKEGIHKYWSRNGAPRTDGAPKRKIVVGGADWEVTTTAIDDKTKGVQYSVGYWVVNKRACNYDVLVPGLGIGFMLPRPGETPFSDEYQRETGAHEFGHSVLKDGWGYDYSLRHKGSSTAGQSAIGPPYPPAPAEIDLMVYYSDDDDDPPLDLYKREVATEEDVKALIATVRLEFTSK